MLNRILPALAEHDVGVFIGVRERPDEAAVPELDLMRILERQILNDLLLPLLDGAPAPQRQMRTPRQMAEASGGRLTMIHDMHPDGGMAAIEGFGADLILSVRFSYLFRRSTIARTPLGIINVHPGPLPHFRGLFTPFWQMSQQRPVLQCTVHLVDPGVDTGPVLAIEDVPVRPERSLIWHMMELYGAGVTRALQYIRDGVPTARAQDETRAGHYRAPSPADFARFRALGFTLVNADDYRALLAPFVHTALPLAAA